MKRAVFVEVYKPPPYLEVSVGKVRVWHAIDAAQMMSGAHFEWKFVVLVWLLVSVQKRIFSQSPIWQKRRWYEHGDASTWAVIQSLSQVVLKILVEIVFTQWYVSWGCIFSWVGKEQTLSITKITKNPTC